MCRFWSTVSEVNPGSVPLKAERMKRILIVDDDEDFRLLCRNHLSEQGYLTYSSAAGQDALRFLDRRQNIDLIVLDLSMPLMDGIEFLEELRRKNISIPVIIYSGHPDYMNSEIRLADAFLVKKPDFKELIEKINEILTSGNEVGNN